MFTLPAYVGIILQKNNKVFLVQRHNTDWMPGHWNFPGGLVEKAEPLLDTAMRETKEEIGVLVQPDWFTLVHVIHVHASKTNTKDILGFYFLTQSWSGEPKNNEVQKHSDAAWFDINALPSNITQHAHLALHGIKTGTMYSQHGWNAGA